MPTTYQVQEFWLNRRVDNWTITRYEIATDEEVKNYFEVHLDHQNLITNNWASIQENECEWSEFAEIEKFFVVPDVGLVPSYLEELILDDRVEPDWYQGSLDVYQLKVYRLLWFTAYFREVPYEREIVFFPLTRYEETVAEAELISAEYDEDYLEYWLEWTTREFSNGKRFSPLAQLSEVSISELEEVETFPAIGFDDPQDLRASLFLSKDGTFIVGVSYFSSISIMRVDSEAEARSVISEIWP